MKVIDENGARVILDIMEEKIDDVKTSIPSMVCLTKAEYDALENKEPNTLYLVQE